MAQQLVNSNVKVSAADHPSVAQLCDAPRQVETFYDASYFDWQQDVNKGNVHWQREYLNKWLEQKPGGAVLEIGCSAGYTLASIKSNTKHCHEINPAAVKFARATHNHLKMHTTWADIPNSLADFAYSFDSFEHHPSPMDNLRCLNAKMKRGGIVFISVPFEHTGFGGAVEGVYGRWFEPNDKHNHLYTWNPLLLGNLLTAAGFKVQECTNAEAESKRMRKTGTFEKDARMDSAVEKLQIWCVGIAQ